MMLRKVAFGVSLVAFMCGVSVGTFLIVNGILRMADDGKRYPLNMRTTKETRDKLEAAAKDSGRSLVQEVEHRLQLTFDLEKLADILEKRRNER